MRNLAAMMQKAKEVQDSLAEMRAEIADLRFSADAGSGAVTVEVNGKGEITDITLSPEVMKMRGENDLAMLEDLIQVAANQAKLEADQVKAEKIKALTGDLPLPPGLDMPL
jgi:DNA-binding YbaB/EbfC family protein